MLKGFHKNHFIVSTNNEKKKSINLLSKNLINLQISWPSIHESLKHHWLKAYVNLNGLKVQLSHKIEHNFEKFVCSFTVWKNQKFTPVYNILDLAFLTGWPKSKIAKSNGYNSENMHRWPNVGKGEMLLASISLFYQILNKQLEKLINIQLS